jgi:hypothetical protein
MRFSTLSCVVVRRRSHVNFAKLTLCKLARVLKKLFSLPRGQSGRRVGAIIYVAAVARILFSHSIYLVMSQKAHRSSFTAHTERREKLNSHLSHLNSKHATKWPGEKSHNSICFFNSEMDDFW